MRIGIARILLTIGLAMTGCASFGAAAIAADTNCTLTNEKGECVDNTLSAGTYRQDGVAVGTYNQSGAGSKTLSGYNTSYNANGATHGVMMISNPTYVYAYNRCRYVDPVAGIAGSKSIHISLQTKGQWLNDSSDPYDKKGGFTGEVTSRANTAGNVGLTPCCVPITVTICGKTKSVGLTKIGSAAKTFTGGDTRKAVVSCVNNLTGTADTEDTSWKVTWSGQCDAPANDNDNNCNISNDKDWCNSGGGGGGGSSGGGSNDKHGDKAENDPNNGGNGW